MESELKRAIALREDGKQEESNQLLIELVKEYPSNAIINYQCAWSFDVLGKESNAVPYYEKAIELGLPEKELEGALIGLGSTYRTLGDYEKSKQTFIKGFDLFPTNRAIQIFYSMTLYNLNEHSKAMEILLQCLVSTTTDGDVLSYKEAILFYSDKLDTRWS